MKFSINRNTWLRGEGAEASRLLRFADKKMCCLGFYLRACGVPTQILLGANTPYAIRGSVPKEAAWLLHPYVADMSALMEENDSYYVTEKGRERRIKEIFARHSVLVEFEGVPTRE